MEDILLKPLVSEKFSTEVTGMENRVAFFVNTKANKLQIKKAVEKMYNVNVVAVNTIKYDGKTKQRYTKTGIMKGKTNAVKKAIITLADGDSIDFFSNI